MADATLGNLSSGSCFPEPDAKEPATEKSDNIAFVRQQDECNKIEEQVQSGGVQTKVPDWFHEAMVDHVFRVDATINNHTTKATTEMESVKLDLWKLQQQQRTSSRGSHDSSNAGHQLKRLGRRVEEIAESLQHQQCTLQEVLGRMVSLVQSTVIAQKRCDDTERRLQDALHCNDIATQDKSDCPRASQPQLQPSMVPPVPVSDQSGGMWKACRELEATISAKLDSDEKAMKEFVVDHVLELQNFAVALEVHIKQCNLRMAGIEESAETVTQVLRKTVQAVKALRKEQGHIMDNVEGRTSGLYRKTKRNQAVEMDNFQEVDEKLGEAMESVKQMGDAQESLKKTWRNHTSDTNSLGILLHDQAPRQSTSSVSFVDRLGAEVSRSALSQSLASFIRSAIPRR